MLKYVIPWMLVFGAVAWAKPDNSRLADKSELYLHLKNAFKNPKDDGGLPRVLLIGDSISIGYTVPVRKVLKEKASVHRIPTNGQHSTTGRKMVKKWIGAGDWDVIHFNWGLWDVCYRHPKSKNQGHRDKVNGTLTTTPEVYRENLEAIVAELKKTKATLVWCATTPVPAHEFGRIEGDEIAYNAIAAEVMKANGIRINDLHGHAMKEQAKHQKKKGDVHYKASGYDYLAKKVAAEIMVVLNAE